MNADDEFDDTGSDGPLGDALAEYHALYASLDPAQRLEADVQRAIRLISLYADMETPSPEIHRQFVEWFARYGECPHVEEAFIRYLDRDDPDGVGEAQSNKTICENVCQKPDRENPEWEKLVWQFAE